MQKTACEGRMIAWSAVVCSSDLFIQAAHAIVADAHLDDRGKMLGFWRKGEPPAIGNAQRVGFQWRGGPLGMCADGRRLDQHPLYPVECHVIGPATVALGMSGRTVVSHPPGRPPRAPRSTKGGVTPT